MEHFHGTIGGWCSFARLYERVVREAPAERESCFVEVGSWLGRSAAFMAVEIINSGKPIKFTCVDPWSDGGPDLAHKVAKMQEPIYSQFLRNIAPVAHIVQHHRIASPQAADLFDDCSLDFVMIDGSHQYADVVADIAAWRPKIKEGGLLAGDDFNWPGVRRAVYEAFVKDQVLVEATKKQPKIGSTPKFWSVRL